MEPRTLLESDSGLDDRPEEAALTGAHQPTGRLSTLEHLPTGTFHSLLLDSVDRTEHNGHDLVHLIQARVREISRLQAELFSDMIELSYCPPSGPGDPPLRQQEVDEFCVDELRAALRWTRRAADNNLDLAWRLVERLPRVWEALRDGWIDLPRARTIVHSTDHLDEAMARGVADQILDRAPDITTGQLRAALRRLCIEADPDDAAKRYEEGLEERRVVAEANPDGTADLFGLKLPVDRVAAIQRRIARIAQNLKTRREQRTLDQIKADVFLQLLEGHQFSHSPRSPASSTAGRPKVDISVPLTTLLELDEQAGEIPGWGPVIADIARQAVERSPDGSWRVVVTDPDSGAVLWDGTTKRRPTAAQRRYVEVRQTVCVFPTCRLPATQCDLDHEIQFSKGGPTVVRHLHPGCRHDHNVRHKGGWKVRRLAPGVYEWTSRHGHVYVTRPPP
ncbi:MAG TPA: DUF222 domain-containing protein [Acidimicrobiia bacterium]|nr:DUF222 domain-containing protein [Acidimicrobiia bacterium]